MLRITLIRHGESEWNREGRVQGDLDSDLSELGREQAQCLKQRLDLEVVDFAYASTATRALETCRIAVGDRVEVEARLGLREINLGEWEGERIEALRARLPKETDMWFQTPSKLRIPGGESMRSFRRRVTREMSRIIDTHAGDDAGVVVVTHGGAICAYLTSFLGLKLDDLWRFKIRNGSITRLIFPDGFPRIEVLNDVSHLNGAIRYAPNTPPKYLL